MRRTGDRVEPILSVRRRGPRGCPMHPPGIDNEELAAEETGFECGLRVVPFSRQRHRKIKHATSKPGRDEVHYGIRGIGQTCHVPPCHWTEHRLGLLIHRKRSGKVDDDLVVGPPAGVFEATSIMVPRSRILMSAPGPNDAVLHPIPAWANPRVKSRSGRR